MVHGVNDDMSPAAVKNLDAILFDLDGVLIDSSDAWLNAYNHVLRNQQQNQLTEEEFKKEYWGKGLRDNLNKIDPSFSITEFCQNIFPHYNDEISLIQDSIHILRQLQSTYMLGLITNAPKQCAVQLLKKSNIKKYFEVIITSDQVKNEKPAPDMILQACDILGLTPKCVVYVGDTQTDVDAGENAGCTSIGIGIDADFSIRRIDELPHLLKRITTKVVETGEQYPW